MFERALVVRDQFTGGQRTFLSSEDAKDFRAEIYRCLVWLVASGCGAAVCTHASTTYPVLDCAFVWLTATDYVSIQCLPTMPADHA